MKRGTILSLTLCVLLAVSVMFTGCSFLKSDKMEIAPLQEQPEQTDAPAAEDAGNKFAELGSAPSSQHAEICLSFELNSHDSNTLSSEFRDSWGNSGINKNKIEDGIYFPREILLQHYI